MGIKEDQLERRVIPLEREEPFHFARFHVHEKLFSLRLFYQLESRKCLGSDPDSLLQAGNGARRAREPLRGRDGDGERHGSPGAGCLPSVPLVQVQRPRTQAIHTVRTRRRSAGAALLQGTELSAGPGTRGQPAALCQAGRRRGEAMPARRSGRKGHKGDPGLRKPFG